jgi:hypothetical protein
MGGAHVSKFNVKFSDGTHEVLVDLSQKLETSMAEVIREALSLYWWVARERSAGSRLLVQRGDEVTELVIPSLERLTQEMAPARQPDSEVLAPAEPDSAGSRREVAFGRVDPAELG